ncbi:MAG TPA: alpha-L-rhamnosidase C-terminal domain-containing protein [Chthoniobacterales bacterium]|nr:alpha-L-rhamnosidase C-terminal domain-containing protein [Chthoniobacterales bacterium]
MERHWRFPFFSRRALARILAGGSQSRISHRTSIKIGASVCFGLLAISPQLYGQKNPWPTNPKWQHYVLGPNNPDVYPVKIVSVSGSVTNPQGLVNPNPSEGTTFTTSSASAPASVLLDYGQDTNGFPWFEVTSSQGSPTLVAAYSEGLQYIQANPTQGDNSPPYSSAGDPSRADSYTVTAPGTIVNQYIQGGERFQAITLTTPGTVTLKNVGIRFAGYRATAANYPGYFVCNSDLLNRVWYSGAYTVQLDQLPANIVPLPWSGSSTGMVATGGPIGLLKAGTTLTDYQMTFSTQILNDQSGWIVQAQDFNNAYVFILNADNDTVGTPNSLQVLALSSGNYTSVETPKLPFDLKPGTWHTVQTSVAGTKVTVSVDSTQIVQIDFSSVSGAPVFTSGDVGFRENGAESAEFKDLSVVASSGTIVFENSLETANAENYFNLENGTNVLPVVLDGAKRDRVVWGGDLSVEGPTTFYSTATDEYIKDSLLLLGSYQQADGEAGSNISPTSPIGTFPENVSSYSAPYSMYFILNLAQYYLFTGDSAFVKQEWPVVEGELLYLKGLTNSQGLFVSDSSDGMDWHYYDGALTGMVTAYNALYYKVLMDAAFLAPAANQANLAAGYEQQAATVKNGINSNLFDSVTGIYDLSSDLRGTIAQDGNSLAVLYDIAPSSLQQGILSILVAKLSTPYGPLSFSTDTGFKQYVSGFASNMELQALFHINDAGDAMNLINTVWGEMIAPGDDYSGADWEVIDLSGLPGFGAFTSLAHGWASGATPELSAYVLGVRPVTPGYKTWIVQPQPGKLQWAEGQAPTPYGPITVKWGISSGQLVMEVSAPVGTSGTLAVPKSNAASTVTLNGKPVWQSGRPIVNTYKIEADSNFIYLNNVPGGTYRIECQ